MHFIRRSLSIFAFFTIFFGLSQCQSSLGTFRNGFERSDEIFTTERNRDSIVCMDIYPQRAMDMNQIMGKWYGNEIIIHSQDVPGVFQYDSCVIIQIADVTDQMQNHYYNDYRHTAILHQHDSNRQQQQQYQQRQHRQQQQHDQNENPDLEIGIRRQPPKYIRLLWSERDDTLEYIFNYTTESPGRWTNVGEQHGSFVTLNHYTQFSGTVQVVKAVNDHLVLTFCGNDLKSTIYTIVLSRKPKGLTSQELYSIRTLLSDRHLSIDTIRKICASAADSLKSTIVSITLLLVIASILRMH